MTRAVRSIAFTAAIGLIVYLGTVVWFYFALQAQINTTTTIATVAHAKADDDRLYQIANCNLSRRLAAIALTDARARIKFEAKPNVDTVTKEQGAQWKATEKQLAELEAPICPPDPPRTKAVPTSPIKPIATPSPVSNVRIERASRPLVARTGD